MERLGETGNQAPTTSDSRISRTSRALTRSQSSQSTEAAADVVGRILNRFRMAQGWAAEDPENHKLRVAAWLEVLGVARVPVERYDELYRRALDTRTRKQAQGLEVFYVRPDDLVVEWLALREAQLKPSIGPENCPERADHLSEAEALRDYGFPGEVEEWLPCHLCRPEAYRRRVAEVKAQRSEIDRAEKVQQRIRLMLSGTAVITADTGVDARLDEATARLREQPGNEALRRRYVELVEEKRTIREGLHADN